MSTDKQATFFSATELTRYLAHAYPFRLVDSLELPSESEVIGRKYIGWNEPFFQGHFPQNPIMPGVLQVEMIAQVATAGLAVRQGLSDYKVLLASIDRARFFKPVLPGCVLEGYVQVMRVINGVYILSGNLKVNEELVSEVEIKALFTPYQRTLCIIKPDAVDHAQEILEILNLNGLKVAQVKVGQVLQPMRKKVRINREIAQLFYQEHVGKPFFGELCDYITGGDLVAMVLTGEDAVVRYRELMGATDPKKAGLGTLRSMFGRSIDANAVHGSDSVASATREIGLLFPELATH